jgi:AcrR family transcriptional regulator
VSPRHPSPSSAGSRSIVVTEELSADHGPTVRRQIPGRGSSREAILDAAGQLLVTRGLVALTLDAVARRADVEASLISRWWPSEEALALDALRQEWLALAVRVRRRAVLIGL